MNATGSYPWPLLACAALQVSKVFEVLVFTPTQRCQIPESRRMVEVCQANEARHRARFEADWATSKGA